MIMQELGLEHGEATALMMVAGADIKSRRSMEAALGAVKLFKKVDDKSGQASALHAVANGILLGKGNPKEALSAAEAALALHKETGNKQGEAIMTQTVANCYLFMRDFESAVPMAIAALWMFKEVGDDYGGQKALSILDEVQQKGGDKGEILVHEGLRPMTGAPPLVELDEYEAKKSAATKIREKEEEEANRNEIIRTVKAHGPTADDVNWEMAWIPQKWPFPDTRGADQGRGRRMVITELTPSSIAKLKKGKRAPKVTPGQDILRKTGNMLPMTEFERAMKASDCTGVVFDCSKLLHMGPLPIMEGMIKIVQAMQQIENGNIVLDCLTLSGSQGMSFVGGKRRPIHAGIWGFLRTCRQEYPTMHARILDLDATHHVDMMHLVIRYLLGAPDGQRPIEAMVRDGALHALRLVGGRTQLKKHYRITVSE